MRKSDHARLPAVGGLEAHHGHDGRRDVGKAVMAVLDKLVDYMYLHYDVFMLLLTGAQGSEYENTVDMIVDMTEKGFRISAEKAAARMPNCHVDEYMLHWITHISVDAYTHLLTHERDVEKAKLHMRRVMEFLIKIWFTMIVED